MGLVSIQVGEVGDVFEPVISIPDFGFHGKKIITIYTNKFK